MKINLGCGKDIREGWLNIDRGEYDLNNYPYPWVSVNYILASHIIEHLDEPIRFMQECYNILDSKGLFEIILPHYSSPYSASPYHKSSWSVISMELFFRDSNMNDNYNMFNLVSLSIKIMFIGWINVSFRHAVIIENFLRIEEFKIILETRE